MDEASVFERLTRDLELSPEEANLYLKALKKGVVTQGGGATLASLCARGMLVPKGNEKAYQPVHPRLALSNLFRSYQDRVVLRLREKRKLVDRLTLELIPVYEASGEPK